MEIFWIFLFGFGIGLFVSVILVILFLLFHLLTATLEILLYDYPIFGRFLIIALFIGLICGALSVAINLEGL